MKLLVIGTGSIGERHLRCFQFLGKSLTGFQTIARDETVAEHDELDATTLCRRLTRSPRQEQHRNDEIPHPGKCAFKKSLGDQDFETHAQTSILIWSRRAFAGPAGPCSGITIEN